MSNLTAEQATFLLERGLPVLKNEHRITAKIIAAIPVDKGDYRPDPVAMSAFELAKHIAGAENLFVGAAASGEFNFTAKIPDTVRNSSDLARWYDESFEKNIATLQTLGPDQLQKILDFRGKMQLPAVDYLPFAISHTIHHRGQLSTYLRPMGAKVPSMYGESYDAAQARKAAESQKAAGQN